MHSATFNSPTQGKQSHCPSLLKNKSALSGVNVFTSGDGGEIQVRVVIQLMRTKYLKTRTLLLKDAAYIAGFIDGEGTITLTYKQKRAERHLAITVSNNERQILDYIRTVVGAGKITRKLPVAENHAMSFTYQLYSRQALDLLKQITPFMKSYKKERAVLALKKYISVTPRNGQYSLNLQRKRKLFTEQFFQIVPY